MNTLVKACCVKCRARESGRALFWLVVIVSLFFLFIMMTVPGIIEPGFVLLFGWVQFLQRTVSAMSWNWDLIGMGVLASAGILFLGHKLLGGIANKVAVAHNLPRRWSWKWTWSGFVGLLILFLVGMAIGGIAHQIGWMMSTNEPMIEAKNRKWRDYSNMKQLDLEVRMALDDVGGDAEKVRSDLRSDPSGYTYDSSASIPTLQAYHVLLVKGQGEKVVGRLIFPRDGRKREQAGGYFSFDSGESGLCPWPKMQEIVKTNRANLIAL
ncbi:MAG: hypothetical protein HOP33_07770 [Verrucomicrobia bacterium]|nr:hypothetical protein [Verrucomicrobiota bacterium]